MSRKSLKTGVIALMLMASMAPVSAYHIDSRWSPVEPATDMNTECPPRPAGEPGTDCNNAPARGWLAGGPGAVICEQNNIGHLPGEPATNGMCFASNQVANTNGEICGDETMFDPTRGSTYNGAGNTSADAEPGGQTPSTSHVMYYNNTENWAHHQCMDKHNWTKLWIFDSFNEDFESGGDCNPNGDTPYNATEPHRCIPKKGNVYAQVRVGTNANGILLTPRDDQDDTAKSPTTCADSGGYGDTLGGTDGAGRDGTCDPRDDGPFFTFYYRELIAYWIDGGHVTFFINQAATTMHNGNPPVLGSYWAQSLAPGTTPQTPADDNDGGLDGLECNALFDDRILPPDNGTGTTTKVYRAETPTGTDLRSYFDIFEPVTYVAMNDTNVNNTLSIASFLDDAATTVCRGNSALDDVIQHEPRHCGATVVDGLIVERGCPPAPLVPPKPCALNGCSVVFFVPNACHLKDRVNVTATLFSGAAAESVTATVYCGVDVIVTRTAIGPAPPVKTEASPKTQKDHTGNYICELNFVKNGLGGPYSASAKCQDP